MTSVSKRDRGHLPPPRSSRRGPPGRNSAQQSGGGARGMAGDFGKLYSQYLQASKAESIQASDDYGFYDNVTDPSMALFSRTTVEVQLQVMRFTVNSMANPGQHAVLFKIYNSTPIDWETEQITVSQEYIVAPTPIKASPNTNGPGPIIGNSQFQQKAVMLECGFSHELNLLLVKKGRKFVDDTSEILGEAMAGQLEFALTMGLLDIKNDPLCAYTGLEEKSMVNLMRNFDESFARFNRDEKECWRSLMLLATHHVGEKGGGKLKYFIGTRKHGIIYNLGNNATIREAGEEAVKKKRAAGMDLPKEDAEFTPHTFALGNPVAGIDDVMSRTVMINESVAHTKHQQNIKALGLWIPDVNGMHFISVSQWISKMFAMYRHRPDGTQRAVGWVDDFDVGAGEDPFQGLVTGETTENFRGRFVGSHWYQVNDTDTLFRGNKRIMHLDLEHLPADDFLAWITKALYTPYKRKNLGTLMMIDAKAGLTAGALVDAKLIIANHALNGLVPYGTAVGPNLGTVADDLSGAAAKISPVVGKLATDVAAGVGALNDADSVFGGAVLLNNDPSLAAAKKSLDILGSMEKNSAASFSKALMDTGIDGAIAALGGFDANAAIALMTMGAYWSNSAERNNLGNALFSNVDRATLNATGFDSATLDTIYSATATAAPMTNGTGATVNAGFDYTIGGITEAVGALPPIIRQTRTTAATAFEYTGNVWLNHYALLAAKPRIDHVLVAALGHSFVTSNARTQVNDWVRSMLEGRWVSALKEFVAALIDASSASELSKKMTLATGVALQSAENVTASFERADITAALEKGLDPAVDLPYWHARRVDSLLMASDFTTLSVMIWYLRQEYKEDVFQKIHAAGVPLPYRTSFLLLGTIYNSSHSICTTDSVGTYGWTTPVWQKEDGSGNFAKFQRLIAKEIHVVHNPTCVLVNEHSALWGMNKTSKAVFYESMYDANSTNSRRFDPENLHDKDAFVLPVARTWGENDNSRHDSLTGKFWFPSSYTDDSDITDNLTSPVWSFSGVLLSNFGPSFRGLREVLTNPPTGYQPSAVATPPCPTLFYPSSYEVIYEDNKKEQHWFTNLWPASYAATGSLKKRIGLDGRMTYANQVTVTVESK